MIVDDASARRFAGTLCDQEAFDRLEVLASALREENTRQNLVSRGTLDQLWQRHFADSLQLLTFVSRETPTWLDLGTGAGFPGLVIAVARPTWPVTLVESRRKRIEWLEQMCVRLALPRCHVEGRRIETADRIAADVISARAFAPLPRALELARRFSTSDTLWLLPKGRSAEQELNELPKRWRSMFHVEQSQTDRDAKILVGRGAVTR